ncbi:hypothetical protein [Nitrosopumilus sp. Nsub]|uniref:hypothetical protein n=1 Tax=Nitrosopumilus sp. Nsub TaxID=1776294 RepID=UPI000A6998F5|nr:hypothetical protein [Nitrosopumilus sp. Nsub]
MSNTLNYTNSEMNYEKFCSLILGIESQVRGAFVYNNNGDFIAGGMRDSIKSYLPIEEISKSLINTILRWNARELLYPFVGYGKYSFTEYEKIKRITFPLKNHKLLIVGTDIGIDHDRVIKKILQLIESKESL